MAANAANVCLVLDDTSQRFTFSPVRDLQTNIRIAFSAGAATLAIRGKLAVMPDATKTLEDIELQSMASDLLTAARKHLSLPMYAAFLRWAEESIRFTTLIDTDEELNAQAVRHDDALYALNEATAATPADLALKAYIAAVETHDRGGAVGPIDIANRPDWPFGGATLAVGFIADILAMSPVTGLLNDIAARAWEVSNFGNAWTREIGLPLAQLFADALADVPVSQEVLTIGDLARGVIATAHQLLSPRMFTAFLRWGEAASHHSTKLETDEEGLLRSTATAEAIRSLAALPMVNDHDHAVKQYLLMIEATDSSCCGPLIVEDDGEAFNLNHLLRGLASDLVPPSPVTQVLDQLARLAWEYSASTSAWSLPIGEAITSAFSEARGADSVEREYGRQQQLDLSAYDMWMRGPLIAWNRQYDRYLAAAGELATYDRDVHTPTFAVEGRPENGDAVQERYDELVDAMFGEFDRLIGLPAPGPGELAIKLALFQRHDGVTHGNASQLVDKVLIDARRFAKHGAHLLTDKPLLDAYAARRGEFEATYDSDMTPEQESGYFARLDANEGVLCANAATTIEGVIAKLRIAFLHQDGSAWADRAILDPTHPDFVAGLAEADMYTRLKWSAIEDLARIGGVNLAEQGR